MVMAEACRTALMKLSLELDSFIQSCGVLSSLIFFNHMDENSVDADQLAFASGYTPCADPESFVRGVPTLSMFLFVCFFS